jgi:hypothetical protein
MSRTSDLFASLMRIHNTHGLLVRFGDPGKTDLCVMFSGYDRFRIGSIRGSTVWSPSHKVDPKGAWYDRGAKSFPGKRDQTLPLAIEWAGKKYGLGYSSGDWKPCPIIRNSYIPSEVYEKAMNELRALAKMNAELPT